MLQLEVWARRQASLELPKLVVLAVRQLLAQVQLSEAEPEAQATVQA